MRSRFDEQLMQLNRELIGMGAACEEAIARASKALTDGDSAAAEGVLPLENDINRMERDIETLCLRLLLLQQPVARDLRQISAALKMITDMERIGDQAADIAEIVKFMRAPAGAGGVKIADMARAAIKMVNDSLDAYVRRDTELAASVVAYDDVVDGLFDEIKRSLIELISRSPEEGGMALDLLMIAKYFERIGDHAVNLAEWVVFAVTGVHKGETEL